MSLDLHFPCCSETDAAPAVESKKPAGAKAGKGGKGGKAAKGGNSNVDVAKALAHKFEPATFSYTDKEVILYALGVGTLVKAKLACMHSLLCC